MIAHESLKVFGFFCSVVTLELTLMQLPAPLTVSDTSSDHLGLHQS